VEEAVDGGEAVEKAIALSPDAIVMDFNMPNVDGGESARSLAADDRTCRIPIVMLSSLLDRIPVEVRLGCAGLLAKPCSVDELAQVLRAVTLRTTLRSAEREDCTITFRVGGSRDQARSSPQS
jgi:CheY-like chemotaxis protein